MAGGALVMLGARVPGALAAALDAAVAVMLVGLGVSALWSPAARWRKAFATRS